MECKANGVLDSSKDEFALANLKERLARISGELLVPLSQLETVLLGPSYTPGIKGGELRLLRQLEEPNAAKASASLSSWKVIEPVGTCTTDLKQMPHISISHIPFSNWLWPPQLF